MRGAPVTTGTPLFRVRQVSPTPLRRAAVPWGPTVPPRRPCRARPGRTRPLVCRRFHQRQPQSATYKVMETPHGPLYRGFRRMLEAILEGAERTV